MSNPRISRKSINRQMNTFLRYAAEAQAKNNHVLTRMWAGEAVTLAKTLMLFSDVDSPEYKLARAASTRAEELHWAADWVLKNRDLQAA